MLGDNFNRKRIYSFLALLAVGFLIFELLTSNPGYGLQNIKDGDTCISYRKVRFKLNDSAHTVFDIPNGYLFTRYGGILVSERDPATVFLLNFYRKNFRPSCSALTYDPWDIIEASVRPMGIGTFPAIQGGYQNIYTVLTTGTDSDFDLYRANETVKSKTQRANDFLIPKDAAFAGSLFVECGTSIGKREGCSVRSKLTETSYLTYSINHTDLPNYKEIDQGLRRVISGFITSKTD